jgi:segregation and condensation protein B
MSKDAVVEFQELGQQLDAAAETLHKARPRRSRAAKLTPIAPVEDANSTQAPAFEEDAAAAAASSEVAPDGVVTADATADHVAAPTGLDVGLLEALIFSSRHPLTASRIGELLDVPSSKALRAAIAQLNQQYEASGRTFRIEQVAGGYQMLTLPSYGETLLKFHQREIDAKLSRSALETLAIIAYKQPVLRAEVEAIRGVASGETIRSLMEKHLVKIAGRAEEAGRPILYGTTKRFLEVFGLNSLKELPSQDNARPLPGKQGTPKPEGPTSSFEPQSAATDASAFAVEGDAPSETVPPDAAT